MLASDTLGFSYKVHFKLYKNNKYTPQVETKAIVAHSP